MLGSLIFDQNALATHPAVITRNASVSWAELRDSACEFADNCKSLANRRVGVFFSPNAGSYALLAALDRLAVDAFLFDSRLPLPDVLGAAKELKLAVLISAEDDRSTRLITHELPDGASWSGASTVTILTSGSTGKPKAARHSWESLCRPVRRKSSLSRPRWLLTYRPHLYAGLQVMLQCFADQGTLVIADSGMDPRATVQLMAGAGVHYASATPSFWRRLLIFSDRELLRKIPILQITLGGEVVDQSILDQLRYYFPETRLAHIYATTELGRCFSVTDGIAGFPPSFLNRVLPDGIEMKVVDGELLVRSANSMQMYDPYSPGLQAGKDWFPTGDLVEVQAERVFFVGRKSDLINVAGSKVYPIEVERTIRSIPGVSDVRVYGKASSIAGELVACEIVPVSGVSSDTLRETVVRVCQSQLATYQQPRMIKFVERIDLSAAGKILRSKG